MGNSTSGTGHGLERELAFSLELARGCGAIANRIRGGGATSLDARDKGAGQGLITRADTEINQLIVERVSSEFPGDAIVAEETVEDAASRERRARDRCWFIDPVDGTKEYARGEDSWAIHIGLCIAGDPVLGVVYEPAVDRMSWGVRGQGHSVARTKTGDGAAVPLAFSNRTMGQLRLVSSKSHSSPQILDVMAALGIDEAHNLRMGSTGVKMMTIARGHAEVYVHPRSGTKLWDSCAPQAVLFAAGGVLTDVSGRPLTYVDGMVNDRGLLAAPGHLHGSIVEVLAPLAAQWFE